MPTKDSQSRKEKKVNIRVSGLTDWHLISQRDIIATIEIVPVDFRSAPTILKYRRNTDQFRGNNIQHAHVRERLWTNIVVFTKGRETSLKFFLEKLRSARLLFTATECFQEANLGTSAPHKTQLPPGEVIPMLQVLVSQPEQKWKAGRAWLKDKKACS